MILNTGGRTDTVQYFSEWLLNRFAAGYALSRNPFYPSVVNAVSLDPATVDVVVFCSKDYRPLLPRLHEITSRFRCYFHYTITAYGIDIEPRVPSIDDSMRTLIELSDRVGARRVAWRYDPVLLTDKYTIGYHLHTFESMTARLAPHVDRCIFSFVLMYKKLEANMPELRPLTADEKATLAQGMGAIARRYGMTLQTCATDIDFAPCGIQHSGCMTASIFEQAFDIRFRKVAHRGNRPHCRCMESRGLGDYNTCLNGCRYCYANADHALALRNYSRHDPASPLLLGHLLPTDTVVPIRQQSLLDTSPRLF